MFCFYVYCRFLLDFLTGQLVYGIELVGKDAVSVCVKSLGDRDPTKAAPGTIRALYGTDSVRNCVHASSTPDNAIQVNFQLRIQKYVIQKKNPKHGVKPQPKQQC